MDVSLPRLVIQAHREHGDDLTRALAEVRDGRRAPGAAMRNLAHALRSDRDWHDAEVLARHAEELEAMGSKQAEPGLVMTIPRQIRERLPQVVRKEMRSVRNTLSGIFNEAQEEVLIVAPYTTIDAYGDLAAWIAKATRRGVRVEVYGDGSQSESWNRLYEQIRAYVDRRGDGSLLRLAVLHSLEDALSHAKVVIQDQDKALVGSINMTGRAWERNLEAGITVEGRIAKRLHDVMQSYIDLQGSELHA